MSNAGCCLVLLCLPIAAAIVVPISAAIPARGLLEGAVAQRSASPALALQPLSRLKAGPHLLILRVVEAQAERGTCRPIRRLVNVLERLASHQGVGLALAEGEHGQQALEAAEPAPSSAVVIVGCCAIGLSFMESTWLLMLLMAV
jgi:hypothetical protein